jgi:hypothetical protein
MRMHEANNYVYLHAISSSNIFLKQLINRSCIYSAGISNNYLIPVFPRDLNNSIVLCSLCRLKNCYLRTDIESTAPEYSSCSQYEIIILFINLNQV